MSSVGYASGTVVLPLFRRRKDAAPARAPGLMASITLRLARADDTDSIERLAALYDRAVPSGPMLLGLVDDELQAALTLAGDRELMEPYLPTAALVELLELRAKHIREQSARLSSAEDAVDVERTRSFTRPVPIGRCTEGRP